MSIKGSLNRAFSSFKKLFKPDEITYLKRAIYKTQDQINDIEDSFDPKKYCCTTCMSGGMDLYLYRKLNRQLVWLRVLLRKKGRLQDVKELECLYGKKALDFWQKNINNL